MFRVIPKRALTEPRVAGATAETTAAGTTARLRIEGLLCSACAVRVRRHLESVDGVRAALVDLERSEARVDYDPGRTGTAELSEAVERAVVLRPARRLLAALSRRWLARSEH